MSVLGSRAGLLFCEGEPDSLDIHILNRVVSGTTFTIVPARGKYGLANFIDGYCERARHRGRCLAFRDRDLDCEPSPTPGLARLAKGHEIYMSHRSCVESYLLEPELLHQYWSQFEQSPRWAHGPAWEEAKISAWIEDAARALAPYQAVRWGLARLKPGEAGSGWPVVRSTWTKKSGVLPDSLAADSCLANARELVARYVYDSSGVGVRALSENVLRYQQLFASPAFWEQRLYRVWFHGKDLKKMMGRLQPKAISLDAACRWGMNNLDWRQHPDLVELHALSST